MTFVCLAFLWEVVGSLIVGMALRSITMRISDLMFDFVVCRCYCLFVSWWLVFCYVLLWWRSFVRLCWCGG